jgi:hypothetical protein
MPFRASLPKSTEIVTFKEYNAKSPKITKNLCF